MTQSNQQQDAFIAQAEDIAVLLYAQEVLSSGRPALPPDAEVIPGIKADDVNTAMERSTSLLGRADIRQRICPGLLSINDDIKEICKVVGAVLFPLSLVPASTIPLSPLVVAAIAVMVLRAGIKTICHSKTS
jgi:hypothetical protein